MTDAELEAIAVKCGIYWVSEKTAYMHADTMRAFADALTEIERERCAAIVQANADACEPGSMLAVCLASNAAAIRAV